MSWPTLLRWVEAGEADIQSPHAYLATIVTRLCLDQLKSARARREQYVGPWLPEPLLVEEEPDVAETVALSESLTLAFLTLLEQLSLTERAVLLLHDAFGFTFAEIAPIVGKTPANCRQIRHRARARLDAGAPRLDPPAQPQLEIAERFVQLVGDGDLPGLLELLRDDVTIWADGGGKVAAATRPIHGGLNTARFLIGIMQKAPEPFIPRIAWVNRQPGVVVSDSHGLLAVLALDIVDGRIAGVRNVANPDKLRALRDTAATDASTAPRKDRHDD